MKPDLTKTEVLLLRQLITDRREERFRRAEKAASDMDNGVLSGCVEEIQRLDALKEKLDGRDDG